MKFISKIFLIFICSSTLFSLENHDREVIEKVIYDYADSWNHKGCIGFGKDFSEDADFVNIFGMLFSGKGEIEERHVQILQTFLKDSFFTPEQIQLREVNPGLVIAHVHWKVDGFNKNETKTGIFTHVFIQKDGRWEVTASQNTLKLK